VVRRRWLGKKGFQGNCHACGQYGHSIKFCPNGQGKSMGKGKDGQKGNWIGKGEKAKEKVKVSPVSATRACSLVTRPGSVRKEKKGLTWLSTMLGSQRWKVSSIEVKK
jgi:hypothetical protein